MTNKKKIILILGVISLLFTLNMVEQTYAKYVSRTSTEAKMNIAKWDIIVNDAHIKSEKETIAEIVPNFDKNDNVASGYIAPGSVGYFDVKIDPSNTDVSFNYEITVEPASDSKVSDLILEKYYISNTGKTTMANGDNKITDSIKYSETPTVRTVRIYVKWNDENPQNLDNAQDTERGHNAGENYYAAVKVSLKFTQIKSDNV